MLSRRQPTRSWQHVLGQGFNSHKRSQRMTWLEYFLLQCMIFRMHGAIWPPILISRTSSHTDKVQYVMKLFHSVNVVAWNLARIHGRSAANENKKIWLDYILPKMSQQRLIELQQKMLWGSVSLNLIYSRITGTLFVSVVKRCRSLQEPRH